MCRNIKRLYNFDPPASDREIRDAALQYVRKISGFGKPSQVNEQIYSAAVDEIAAATSRLLDSLTTTAKPRNREHEAQIRKARSAQRFG